MEKIDSYFQEKAKGSFFYLGYNPDENALLMKFIGDISDEDYKSIWHQAFDTVYKLGIENILIDQREIGVVSFSARAWVMVKMFPKIKRELSPDLAGSVLSSSNLVYKSGVQYLVKAFKKISGYKIEFHNNYEESMEWFREINNQRTD